MFFLGKKNSAEKLNAAEKDTKEVREKMAAEKEAFEARILVPPETIERINAKARMHVKREKFSQNDGERERGDEDGIERSRNDGGRVREIGIIKKGTENSAKARTSGKMNPDGTIVFEYRF